MNTIENIKKIALIFFIVLGMAHIASSLMAANHYFLPFSMFISRILDIPFAMIALVYGLVSLRSTIKEKYHKMADVSIVIACFIVFVGLVYISFFISDRANAQHLL